MIWLTMLLGIYLILALLLIRLGLSAPPQALNLAPTPPSGPPALRFCQNRRKQNLGYREYPASNSVLTVMLLHGSTVDSRHMHPMAIALQQAGFHTIVPDLRGHGSSPPIGDIAYIGQLEDDLADLLQALDPTQTRHWALCGHSAGGGLALRIACGSLGQRFGIYLLAAPFIHPHAATTRKGTGGWVRIHTGRLLGIRMLGLWGERIFGHLAVAHFAIPPTATDRVSQYSYRLQANFRPHSDWQQRSQRIQQTVHIMIGSRDEMFVPEAYAPTFTPLNQRIQVEIMPDLDHSDLYRHPDAHARQVLHLKTYSGHLGIISTPGKISIS